MAVRNFNGTSDFIATSIGAAAAAGPLTYAVIVKMGNDSVNSSLLSQSVSAGTQSMGMERIASNNVALVLTQSNDEFATTLNVATGWAIVVTSKGTGTVQGNYSVFPLGGAWTQVTGGNALANGPSVAGGSIQFGRAQAATDFSNMRLAVAAVWNTALSNANVQTLSSTLSTAAWLTLAAGAPAGLWEFNQASTATNVTDLTAGAANQSAISGTTVITGDDPPGWTFTGAAPAATIAPPQRTPLGV